VLGPEILFGVVLAELVGLRYICGWLRHHVKI
jgi:hypothetical protein